MAQPFSATAHRAAGGAQCCLVSSHKRMTWSIAASSTAASTPSLAEMETPDRKLSNTAARARALVSGRSSPLAMPRCTHSTNPARVRARDASSARDVRTGHGRRAHHPQGHHAATRMAWLALHGNGLAQGGLNGHLGREQRGRDTAVRAQIARHAFLEKRFLGADRRPSPGLWSL